MTASSVTSPNASVSAPSSSVPSASSVSSPSSSDKPSSNASVVTPPVSSATVGGTVTVKPTSNTALDIGCYKTITTLLGCITTNPRSLTEQSELTAFGTKLLMDDLLARATLAAQDTLTQLILVTCNCERETARVMAQNRLNVVNDFFNAQGTNPRDRITALTSMAVGFHSRDITLSEFHSQLGKVCDFMNSNQGLNLNSCNKLKDAIGYKPTGGANMLIPPTIVSTGMPNNANRPDFKTWASGELREDRKDAVNDYMNDSFGRISRADLRWRCNEKDRQAKPNPYAGDPQNNPWVYADVLNDGLEATGLPGVTTSMPLVGLGITGMDVFVSLTGRFSNSPSDRSVAADITKIVAVGVIGHKIGGWASRQGGRLGERIGRSPSARIGGAIAGSVAAAAITVGVELTASYLTDYCAKHGM